MLPSRIVSLSLVSSKSETVDAKSPESVELLPTVISRRCGASYSVTTSMYRKHADNVFVLHYSIYSAHGTFIGVGIKAEALLKLLTGDFLLAVRCSIFDDQADSECLQFREGPNDLSRIVSRCA